MINFCKCIFFIVEDARSPRAEEEESAEKEAAKGEEASSPQKEGGRGDTEAL